MAEKYTGIKMTYKDWIIRSDPRKQYSHLFDVYVMVMSDKGTMRKELVGYGYSFERAIKVVMRQALASNKDITDLKQYLKKQEEEMKHLESLIK